MKKFFFLLFLIFSLECFSTFFHSIPGYPGFSSVELLNSGNPNFPTLRRGDLFYMITYFYIRYEFSCPLRMSVSFKNATTGREEAYLEEDVYGTSSTYPGNSTVNMNIVTMVPLFIPPGTYWVNVYLDELQGAPLVAGKILLTVT